MFLHSGASLHGHEYHTPQNQTRKKPFLRSAFPNPRFRSNSSVTLPNKTTPSSPPQRPLARRRPVSEAYVRPISALLKDDSPPRTAVPSAPVVRFKGLGILDPPSNSSMPEDDPSVYDSDASQASCSTPKRRKRRAAAARKSTNYLLAVPPPKNLRPKKALFKTIRPRLLLQLQQLSTNERARPTIDVFPASLIAGPLAAAPYIHRFPRMFGAKGELGPRDLILVKSEDYTAHVEDDDESSTSRRQPVAVLSPGRGQADVGEIVLDDGSAWTCSSQKSHYSFVHVDEHGVSTTVRWVKRSTPKRVASAPITAENPPMMGGSTDTSDSDYRYTFSIINPLTRRHPILATLSSQSLEIYDEYTTPSSSSHRYPPSRPVSGIVDSASYLSRDPPLSPLSLNECSTQRETHFVDEATKKLIMVTGLWLALRLGPSLDSLDAGESASHSQDTPRITPSSSFQCTFQSLPRRQTTSNASNSPSISQPTRIRRAMSTGAAFMQRRRQKDCSEAPSRTSTVVELGRISDMEDSINENVDAPVAPSPAQKKARRTSWFKRLTH
ncbi:hypothetical protein N0V93_002563 [Gnomoniopsis smithogilvyi]|uniref:Uncharacterized protein n=1 Tax=Gnomoniopsis smithogilvyi TaxID=1191159 RepID=A0A9W9CXS4_9PEZI|nr:hypothetical protein N0V93_002563 [Gnomoniopsis smithogilvyi]